MPSLSDAINKHAAERPDNIALRGSGTEFTYKQAADAILAELEARDAGTAASAAAPLPYELIVRGSTSRLPS